MALGALLACDGTEAVNGTGSGADMGNGPVDLGPPPDVTGPPLQGVLQVLGSSEPLAAAAEDDRVWLQDLDGLHRIDPTGSVTLDGADGTLVSVAQLGDDETLIATDRGLFVAFDETLVRSPLSSSLRGSITDMVAAESEFWLATAAGIQVVRDGRVDDVLPTGLQSSGCRLAVGAPTLDGSAVWAACGADLYGISLLRSRAHPEDFEAGAGVGVDSNLRLWAIDVEGALHSRAVDGRWHRHDAIESVRSLAADPSRPDVWFETEDGLFVYDQTRFQAVTGVPNPRLLGLAPDAGALVAREGALLQVLTERRVRLTGLESDGILPGFTTVQIRPLDPASVDEVTASLDGEARPVSPSGAGVWTVSIDPADLDEGSHELRVQVHYTDGETVPAAVRFTWFVGPPPNWFDDVQPIFEQNCALCHAAGASARQLDSAEIWQQQIDSILVNIRNDRMPLPPLELLTPEQIQKVEGWKAAGFPEGDGR